MSSLPRRMQRKPMRERADYEPAPAPFRLHDDRQGYDALHPTRGWRRFCAARVRAFGM
jgi:hypothetical protein